MDPEIDILENKHDENKMMQEWFAVKIRLIRKRE